MLQEAMKLFEKMCEDAIKPFQLEGDDANRSFLWNVKEERWNELWAGPPPRNYQARTPEQAAKLVAEMCSRGAYEPIAFVDAGAMHVVLDENDVRREQVSMVFGYTHEFAKLRTLSRQENFMHAAFIHLLEIDLCNCVDTETLDTFRKVWFTRRDDASSEVSHEREGVSKSLQDDIDASTPIPSRIDLKTTVYDGWEYEVDVTCAVIVHKKNATFSLVPLPGELAAATRGADEAIIEEYSKARPDDQIFLGKPVK